MIPKYRAWDRMRKEMNYKVLVGNCDTDDENWTCPIIWIEEAKDWLHFDDYKCIMLSTGLVDKNGQEIFEGDIVKVTDDDERTNFPDGGIGTICGLDEIFMWYIDGQVHNGLFDISQEYYIEVVGNIYENPKLLEERL